MPVVRMLCRCGEEIARDSFWKAREALKEHRRTNHQKRHRCQCPNCGEYHTGSSPVEAREAMRHHARIEHGQGNLLDRRGSLSLEEFL